MNKKIATLGPKGTFSDLVSQYYVNNFEPEAEITYFDSIKKALSAIGQSCATGVLPIENLSEGFITVVLDHLARNNIFIVEEIILPIQFSYVSHVPRVSEIEKLYVQYIAKGQCSEFIDPLEETTEIVLTDSNIQSLEMARDTSSKSGAVVPSGSFQAGEFASVNQGINDYAHNQTRFVVLGERRASYQDLEVKDYKTSIVVLDDVDRPGLLSEILNSFASRQINLASIISRPSRNRFGRYHFFIDFEGHVRDSVVSEALLEIGCLNKVKVMGSYPKAEKIKLSDLPHQGAAFNSTVTSQQFLS